MRNIRLIVAYDGTDLAGYPLFVLNQSKFMVRHVPLRAYMHAFKSVRSKHLDPYR